MGYSGPQLSGSTDVVQPSIALDRLSTLESKITILARKLTPILQERPVGADKPASPENQLLTMISRQIQAVEALTNAVEV